MDEVWTREYTVECPVTREFAWLFWSDVNNWRLDPDIESVELDGPFAAGSRGVTVSRRSGRVEWTLASVQPKASAVIEVPVMGAIAQFRWTFEDVGEGTRIVQRISISGEGPEDIVHFMESMFEKNAPDGMRKLCQEMVKAAATA
jgi:Polyketide cyclase / dehydrase and lipid transport